MLPGARTPPTEFLNSVSPVKTSVPSISSEIIPFVWPGVCSVRTRQPGQLELGVGLEVAGGAAHVLALARVDQHLGVRPALQGLAQLGDVVAVVVGEQDVGDGQVVLVGLGEQLVHRAARVDQEGVAAVAAATR